MGIFTRFKDIVSSNINTMLDRAEDPDKLIRLMLREMEETLVELKAGCAASMAEAAQTRQQLDEARKTVQQWNRRAELAVQAGREDMAREALAERIQAEERVAVLEGEVTGFADLVARCREDIRMLEERIIATRDKQKLMTERHQHAKTRRQAREKMRAADALDSMQRFEDLEHRINRMESEAELAHSPQTAHADFTKLEHEATISAALAELNARLGKKTADEA